MSQTMLVGISFGMPRQSRQLTAIAGQIENENNAETGTVKASIHYFKKREGKKEIDGLAALKSFQNAWKGELQAFARYPFAGGMKLLPAGLVEQFMQVHEKYKSGESAVWNEWLTNEYPTWLASAPQRMGSLYDPADFPTAEDCTKRFICGVAVIPLSASEQWQHISLISPNLAVTMQKNQDEAVQGAMQKAHAKLWADVLSPIQNMVSQLSKEKGKIYDSLVGNITSVVDLIPAYNEVHKDPNLTALATQVKNQLSAIDPDSLRTDDEVKANALANAKAIVETFSPYARSFEADDEE